MNFVTAFSNKMRPISISDMAFESEVYSMLFQEIDLNQNVFTGC